MKERENMNCTGTLKRYYLAVRPQTNKIHPVHKEGCPFMPDDKNRIYLGTFQSEAEAGVEGRKYITKSCSCLFCAKEAVTAEKNLVTSQITDNCFPTESQLSLASENSFSCFLN